jgi:hypothetical protein
MESVERLFFTSCRPITTQRSDQNTARRPIGAQLDDHSEHSPRPPQQLVRQTVRQTDGGQTVRYLYELAHHGGALAGAGRGQRRHTLGDGAVGLLVAEGGALGVDGPCQHPQHVHVAQPRRLRGDQGLGAHRVSTGLAQCNQRFERLYIETD